MSMTLADLGIETDDSTPRPEIDTTGPSLHEDIRALIARGRRIGGTDAWLRAVVIDALTSSASRGRRPHAGPMTLPIALTLAALSEDETILLDRVIWSDRALDDQREVDDLAWLSVGVLSEPPRLRRPRRGTSRRRGDRMSNLSLDDLGFDLADDADVDAHQTASRSPRSATSARTHPSTRPA